MPNRLAVVLSLVIVACGENRTFPTDRAPYGQVEVEPLPCLPNLDGTIERHELAPTLDAPASYIVTPPETTGRRVNTTGAEEDGRRVWDWSALAGDERVVDIEGRPLTDQWFVSSFPGATFVVPSNLSGTLVAVYSSTDDALLLHGLASAEENPTEGRTLLVYGQPVRLFRFPFSDGSTWREVGEVRNGTLRGLTPWSQDDVYEVQIDGVGELRLPDFTFTQALRVQTHVTVLPKTGTQNGYEQRQSSFVFECFGEVARATSILFSDPADDPGPQFGEALETRVLGWF